VALSNVGQFSGAVNYGMIHWRYQMWGNTVKKGKAVPLQACTGPEGSRKLRLPDLVTTAQDGGRLSALRTGRLYPRKYSLYSFMLEAESTPGP